MKKINLMCLVALAAITLGSTSCEPGNNGETGLSKTEQATLNNYVDDVIVATYSQLATDAKSMLEAVEAIKASTASDKTTLIATAAEAWKTARNSWERSEAYLFGPVDKAGIDPGIDSWPLVLPDLQASIQKWNVATDSYKSLKGDGGDLKGFHAIEYMLFANGKAKTATIATFDALGSLDKGTLTEGEFEDKLEGYLVAVTEELYRCVLQLEAEWNKAGLSSAKKADFEAFGSDITLNTPSGDYASLMKKPSLDNSYYTSFTKAIEEAFVGAVGIADEVGNVKISDPINAEIESAGAGLLEVESWFSHNSITDFTNNVRGIKEAYMGKRYISNASSFDTDTTPAENSLGAYIASKNKAKGEAVVAAANKAIAAVKAMPAPFRDNLAWSSANTAAKTAVAEFQTALEDAQLEVE